MEATIPIPQTTIEHAAPIQQKPEMATPVENMATTKSKDFIKSENNGVLRTLGTFIRTGAGEFFTWIGGSMMPAGAAIATAMLGKAGELKNAFFKLAKDPSFQNIIKQDTSGILTSNFPTMVDQVINTASVFFPIVGIGASAVGLLSSAVGSAIGWSGAKHGSENIQKAYKLGKLAEFGTAALSLVNPVFGALYPIAKGFSVATAFIGHTKRP